MNTTTIQHQYDEIIAPHYDQDPQAVTGSSLERATLQIQNANLLRGQTPLRVLDMGIGTGSFLEKLTALRDGEVQAYGLDISAKMIDIARTKIPDLEAVVDTAANVEQHFGEQSFHLICTHFITGFVPMSELAPKIWNRLAVGGYWSLVAGTMAGFPALQEKANSKIFRWLSKTPKFDVNDISCNPADRSEVLETLERHGFEICEIETFEPQLDLANMDEFLDFAYRGGWLTPFIEQLGLHQAGRMLTLMMNLFFFPVHDHHSIEIALVQKTG